MLPLRFRWFWLGGGLTLMAAVLSLALLPLPGPGPVPHVDKVLHVLAFAFLTVWFLGVFDSPLVLRVMVALAAYGLLIEAVQGRTPFRMADPYDVLSDVIGIFAGWLLAAAGLRRWCGRLESLVGATPR